MPASSQTSPTSGIRRTVSFPQRLAADGHLVDPGTVELLELLEPRGGELRQLGLRADDGHVAALARVDGERQAEVAAAGDVPVAHVREPVVHPLPEVVRGPPHAGVRLEEPRAQLVDRDEPVVRDAEDERRVAAPAEGKAVLDLLRRDELARARRGRRRSAPRPRRCSGRAATRSRCRSGPPRRRASARGGRGRGRARSPRRRSRARCARCPSPPRARPRPRG